jgi:hypothetical protein
MYYLQVKNWSRFQHYTKRRPIWIKLYLDILERPEFCTLSRADKWTVMELFILAAKNNNKIPLQRAFFVHVFPEVDWRSMVNSLDNSIRVTSWFHVISDETPDVEIESIDLRAIFASKTLATCYPRDRVETETEKDPPLPPKGNPSPSNGSFVQFWKLYPRKTGKGCAEKIWLKLRPNPELLEVILASVEKHRNSPDWTKDSGQFIPLPATWLNQRRWEDEVRTLPYEETEDERYARICAKIGTKPSGGIR